MKKTAFALALMLVMALVIGTIGCGQEETTPTPTPLFLEITQPMDGAQVSTSTILVAGNTIPSAVVTALIDDKIEIADVSQDGKFTVTVTLEEGPNLIEVVASDPQNNERSSTIAVIYVP